MSAVRWPIICIVTRVPMGSLYDFSMGWVFWGALERWSRYLAWAHFGVRAEGRGSFNRRAPTGGDSRR